MKDASTDRNYGGRSLIIVEMYRKILGIHEHFEKFSRLQSLLHQLHADGIVAVTKNMEEDLTINF